MSAELLGLPLERRVSVLAALADPNRLRAVDQLVDGDLSPSALGAALGLPGNLVAHHLAVLEKAGVITRHRSEADRRGVYVRLVDEALGGLIPARPVRIAPRVLFVCTHNSARSQLAQALWRRVSDIPAASGGTQPAPRVHSKAVAVGRRHGLSLHRGRPIHVADVMRPDDLVVSVCDSADRALADEGADHLHWSIPDPARDGSDGAFETAYSLVAGRVAALAPTVSPTPAADRRRP